MKTALFSGLGIIVTGLASILFALVIPSSSGDFVVHAGTTVLAAGVLFAVAAVQKWRHFAWLPLLGFAVTCAGYVAGMSAMTLVGLSSFTVLTIWHGHQKEGKGRMRLRPATASIE